MIYKSLSKADIARKYRNEHPDFPTRKLARIMYNKEPLSFIDTEDARSSLRQIEGKHGRGQRVKVTHPKEARPYNPYKLPSSDETDFTPFEIKGHKRLAIFSDIHVPYHSIDAVTAAISFCKKEKPDALLLNGDTIDCHRLSKFIKDPKKRNFKLELDTFKSLIEVFEKELKCKIYFKVGNHEARYEHFLYEKAGELAGVEEFEFENIIKARARGIEFIKDKQIMKANSLNIVHGHEFGGSFFSPVNVARGLALRARTSAIQGHCHQVSENTEVTLDGNIQTTWSTGCLSELHPDYLPINKWAHGFAVVDLADNKVEFNVRNLRIYKGKIL